MKKDTDMSHIKCPACGKVAEEIINAEQKKRVGWWCSSCNHFEKAILREKRVA